MGDTKEKREYEAYMRREHMRRMRRKKRRRQVFFARFICAFFICIVLGGVVLGLHSLSAVKEYKQADGMAVRISNFFQPGRDWTAEEMLGMMEEKEISCRQDFLSVNEYSRPGDKLRKVKNVFVHYTANPGTDAAQNKSYFQNLAETHETSASAHFIIGYEGELIQCVPLDEIAYAVAGRNEDSVSIECCYLDESGQFTEATYETLVRFSAILLEKYGLDEGDLMRHYDDSGKMCPKYYVENEEEWWQFVADVKEQQEKL